MPTHMVEITHREFQTGDLEDIVRIKRSAQVHSMPYKQRVRSPEDEAAYLRETADRCSVFVALKEGVIVGFCAVGNGWIEQLFVDPNHHKNGVGSQLVSRSKELQSNLKALVDLQNISAAAFYERLGFFRGASDTSSVEYEWSRTI